MSLSSFTVCMNALRLNLFKVHDESHDKKTKHSVSLDELDNININNVETEEKKMTKTLNVEGMMCEHCEARVKKALEAVAGVEEAVADHNANTAVVTLSEEVSDDVLRKAVEDQDYKVISID